MSTRGARGRGRINELHPVTEHPEVKVGDWVHGTAQSKYHSHFGYCRRHFITRSAVL